MNYQAPFYDSFVAGADRQTPQMALSPKSVANNGTALDLSNKSPANQLNSSMSKFVAGSFRPEKSDLIAPNNDYWTKNKPNPPPSAAEPYICDLTTPDAQYERYKNLMRSKYYNLNVNSTTVTNEVGAKYSQPAPFTGYSRVIEEQRQQMLDQLKDPLVAGPDLLKNVKE